VFANTVSQEALQRLLPQEVPVAAPRHHHRPYPWGEVLLHPLAVGAAGLPWSVFAVVTLWPGFARLWDERGRRLLQALHCWAWPSLLFWSVIPEHALRHSFPLCPGVAGLAALVWIAWLTGRLRWPLRRVKPASLLLGMIAAWLVVKAAVVVLWVPERDGQTHYLPAFIRAPRGARDPLGKGRQIAALVPPGEPLYLFRLKDEGIMFYYSRSHPASEADRVVRRLGGAEALRSRTEPVYCMVTAEEWRRWDPRRAGEVLLRLPDQQGDGVLLLRLPPDAPPGPRDRGRGTQDEGPAS
jgi:hypothetical protein